MTIPISDRSATSSASATPSVSTGSIGSRYGTIKDLRLGSNNTDNFHLKVTSTLKSHKDDEDVKNKKNESTPVPLEPMVRIEPPQMHSLFWFGSTANKDPKLQRSNSLGDVSKGSMDWQDTMSPASADDTKRSRSHSLPSLMEMCSQIPINSPLTSTSPSTYSPNSAMSIVSSPSASSEDDRSPDSIVSTSSPDSSSSPSHRMTYYRYSPYDSVTSRNTFVREMQGSKPQIRENNNNTTRDNRDDRYNHGRWTNEEHDQFVLGFQMCGRDWSRIAREYVPSRMRSQVASHAQKYLMKLESERPGGSSLQ